MRLIKTITVLLFCCSNLIAERPGEKWIKTFQLAPGLTAELYADEEQLINPVAINFDLQNNLYVAESLRQGKGVSGSARKKFWAKDDFLIKSFKDRYKLHEKHDAKISMKSMTEVSEQLRVLKDTNRDGVADLSEVISADYKELLHGAAAGVAIREGYAYFTCIPNLYKVNLKTGEKEILAHGFGIRIGVHGHDMHAPVWGMDGKLYFNIGDRGFDVVTKEGGRLYGPLEGGVFRCNPDGTQLELYHAGVRNPQGMQFDQYGNLFTVDNDMGAGDKCRVLFLGEGGDSGWNACNQIFRTFRKEMDVIRHKVLPPWISEKLWMQPHDEQPAWINPAAGHLTNGPSGMEYYPGTGFSDKYKDSFFICDHRGNAAGSKTFAFKLEDSGAGFKMTSTEKVISNLLASDVSFGFDGKMYLADWIAGGNGAGKGRIYALSGKDTGKVSYPKKDLKEMTSDALKKLLEHPDKRIRLFSQFELAKRQESELLLDTALNSKNTLARLHGIWGTGQTGKVEECKKLVPLLKGPDSNIRSQTAKVLGENKVYSSAKSISELIADSNLRVRYHALISLGKLKYDDALPQVIEMLSNLKQKDPILRQGVSYYLSHLQNPLLLNNLVKHDSFEVRLNTVLAMRQNKDSRLAEFLNDPNPAVLNEAAAAIYDKNVQKSNDQLAAVIDQKNFAKFSHFNQIRILNGNFKNGSEKNALKVLKAALNNKIDKSVQHEALELILNWQNFTLLDRVLWTPIEKTGVDLTTIKAEIFKQISEYVNANNIQEDLREVCQKILNLYSPELTLVQLKSKVLDKSLSSDKRINLFDKLIKKEKTGLKETLLSLITDTDRDIHEKALQEFVKRFPKSSSSILTGLHNQKSYKNKALLFRQMKKVNTPEIDSLLISEMKENPTPSFELIEAVKTKTNSELQSIYQTYLASQKDPVLAPYMHTLKGGNIKAGKFIFQNSSAQCIRCHKVGKEGGAVGPDLSTIGYQKNTTYLLEAIVNPNAVIAPGFGTIIVNLKDGSSQAGILVKEDSKKLELKDINGKVISIAISQIKDRTKPISGMPPLGALLSPTELRDLIAYLGSLK